MSTRKTASVKKKAAAQKGGAGPAKTATRKQGSPAAAAGAPDLKLPEADWLQAAFASRLSADALSVADSGRSVVLCGWAFRHRDQGGCVFVDLRDRSGLIQLVFDLSELGGSFAESELIRSEFVLCVQGQVRKRSAANINPRLKSGQIEVLIHRFVILNRSETPPFNLDEFSQVNEDIRLRYRYLDMRRDDLARAIYMRSRLNQYIRRFLEDEGFLEVETPVLNKSTPEGARDFLVPSRFQPGKFYALPQSPQLFKQILMIGGIERYFQIVKCFRDEDLRADRQPEFTQLDLEMSFVNEDQVMGVMERLWAGAARELFGVEVPLPAPRMPYREAMERYGSDKPDLRFELPLVDVAEIAAQCQFQVFQQALAAHGRVKALAVPGGARLSRKEIEDLGAWLAQDFGAKGLAWLKHEEDGLKSAIAKFFSEDQLRKLSTLLKTAPGDIVFFGAGREDIVHATLGALRLRMAREMKLIPADRWAFVWVTDFPLFERDHDSGALNSVHHPFTAPHPEDMRLLQDADLFGKQGHKIRSRAYDLALNGVEIGGGSIRIHDSKMQADVFQALGISEEEARDRFGFFLDALHFGAPPHGGIAFGLDRILMLFLGRESIRDVIAFPKTQKGQCLMSESPSTVAPEQLRELRIRTLHAEGKPG
ncbi:MAG: aspartate--tRNA ligase [Leptospirales bacterium]|nr:aspartate--tRNA ligase [Leptospirales bacterium]